MEGLIPNVGNTIRDGDRGQASAVPEGPPPNAGDAISDGDRSQAAAATPVCTSSALDQPSHKLETTLP